MRFSRRVLFPLVGAAVAVLGASLLLTPAAAQETTARAVLHDGTGARVGFIRMVEGPAGTVTVRVLVHGLPAGFHGFHVHAVGSCVPPFTSAGSHFNPGGTTHPGHAADMPVLLVNTDGTGWARFRTDRYTIADLFDADGSALIVHASPDNFANIPTDRYDPDPDATTLATGDAGARIACGVLVAG
jgi:superoxide dismutase, Cu-Zn family